MSRTPFKKYFLSKIEIQYLKVRYILLIFLFLQLGACSNLSFPISETAPSVSSPHHNPQSIALLLPLTGPNGSSGQAIRNGFMAAYYYAKQTLPNSLSIRVIDTNGVDVVALYNQAVTQGADFVVGPLTKPEVQTLSKQGELAVPTLALNTLSRTSKIKNLYQFGLSPQDEVEQIASRAKQEGHTNALVIMPGNKWGTDISNAFAQKWEQLGGHVTARVGYPLKGSVNTVIRNTLEVAQSGQGIDMVFLAAFPSDARQIKPLITFYASKKVAIYAASIVYSGTPSPQDQDLNGVWFVDIPWILESGTPAWAEIRQYIQTLWKDSYDHVPRLYALGIDAYHLTYALDQLVTGVNGTTGKLTLDRWQHIHRVLDWAQFEEGMPILKLNEEK